MKPFYLGSFTCDEDVINGFSDYDWRESRTIPQVDLTDCEILLAYYSQGGYEGDAFVLFRKCGTLYEVNGSHCSCYGLEGQWNPEETDIAALRHRLEEGSLGREYSWRAGEKGANNFAEELTQVLDALETEGTMWHEDF